MSVGTDPIESPVGTCREGMAGVVDACVCCSGFELLLLLLIFLCLSFLLLCSYLEPSVVCNLYIELRHRFTNIIIDAVSKPDSPVSHHPVWEAG